MDVQDLGLLAVTLIALIAGLLIHSFIIGVNVSDWWEGRSVTAVDHIITSLEVSRMCEQFLHILYFLADRFPLILVDSRITLLIFTSFYYFFVHSVFCLTSLLSIVLCLKISNLHSRLFLYLRGIIVHRTGHLIAASGLLSIFNCLLHMMLVITEITKQGTYNTTLNNVPTDCTYVISIYTYTIGVFFPLLFYCVSSVLLFTSLYHHTARMRMSSNLTISLETYYSVMKLVLFTFIDHTIYFIGHLACYFYSFFYCMSFEWPYTIIEVFSILHSSYLIYGTAKLRRHMSKVLHNVTDFLLQKKDTETRENVEVVAQ